MAENALSIPVPTRRSLFGAAFALTAAAATTAHAEYQAVCFSQRGRALNPSDHTKFIAAYDAMRSCREGFIEQVAFLHPDGAKAAANAMSAGMDPDCCSLIILDLPKAARGELPVLQFKHEGAFRTFRPRGEDL
jgi:hypothetical protein